MKKILIFLCLFFPIFANANTNKNIKYKLYYFMSDIRCTSCFKIETYTKEVYNELNNKDVNFEIINIDKKENQKFIKEYNIYTKSVIISKIVDGKEIKYENFDKIWNYLGNKEKFQNYLREEITNFIIKD